MNLSKVAEEFAGQIRKDWGWLIFIGATLVTLGMIGVWLAGTMTLASILYFGVMTLVSGLLMLFDGFKTEYWKERFWEIMISMLYVIAGGIMIAFPGESAIWLTLFIGAFLLVSGILRLTWGIQMRKAIDGWIWIVLGGIASALLAVMIFLEWPISGIWVIGLFVALEMIFQGISLISFGFSAKASLNVHEKTGG